MNKLLRLRCTLGMVVVAAAAHAQYTYPEPGPYIDMYGMSTSQSSSAEDTTFWEHRTYDNGFHSQSEMRDTAWINASPYAKRIRFGSLTQIDSAHYYSMSGSTQTLQSKDVYEYPSAQEVIIRSYQLSGGSLVESSRRTQEHDNNGRLVEETSEFFNSSTGQINYAYRQHYDYSSSGLIDSITTYSYNNGSYDLSDKHWREYNAADQIVQEWYSYYSSGTLHIDQRYEYFYDGSGHLHHIHHYFYDSNTSFELERYYEYEVDQDGRVTLEREYDVIGPDTNTQWFVGHEYMVTYSGGLLASERLDFYVSSGVNTLFDQRYSYSYTTYPSAVNPLNDPFTCKIYPVPADDRIQVEASQAFRQLQVMDLQGRVLWHQSLVPTHSTAVPLHHLPAGTYLIQFQRANGTAHRERFVKG